ncbi:MAG: oligopeptide/dipeptide transporter, peptide-binding protein [Myxococcales bacterium]|nr:oligopeptide/dipeptide transporter, peptide-binding protein [Myxococcales bacterium]
MRFVAAWGLLMIAVVATVACDAGREARKRRDPGALVVAEAADVQALDPVRVTDSESIEVGGLLFEGLVQWKPGTTDVLPGLATSWTVSPDGTKWTFHLRPNVTFHDGTAFDAAAVVFSFERLLDPRHPQYLAGQDALYRRSLLRGITRLVAIDPTTVEIHVSRPYAPLLGDLAMYPLVSPTAVATWGDRFQEHPVGTGPFAFEAWNKGEQVVVRRFEHYWGAKPAIGRIVFRVIVDARQRLVELESGSVDLATSILPDEQPFVDLHPDLILHATPGNDVSYLAFNTQKPPFDDVRVRRAVSYAINKEPIVKLAYQGRAVAADGPLPPAQWAYHKPTSRYPYDPVLARKLLGEAIADKKFDPERTYNLYSLSTPRPYLSQPERVARFLQSALAQIGIKTKLELLPYAEHKDVVESGGHDLAVFGWIGDTGDPDNFLYVLFHSSNARAPSAQNIAFYSEPGVDLLLDDAQAASDEATRTGLYAAVQDRIAADAPWVPLAHSEFVVAARAELDGLILSPLGHPVYALIRRAEAK